jgi:hypothetical protein
MNLVWSDLVERGEVPERQRVLFKGETKRKRLAIPMYRGKVE